MKWQYIEEKIIKVFISFLKYWFQISIEGFSTNFSDVLRFPIQKSDWFYEEVQTDAGQNSSYPIVQVHGPKTFTDIGIKYALFLIPYLYM